MSGLKLLATMFMKDFFIKKKRILKKISRRGYKQQTKGLIPVLIMYISIGLNMHDINVKDTFAYLIQCTS